MSWTEVLGEMVEEGQIMMSARKWIVFVQRISQQYHLVDMGIFFCSFVPYMGIAMGSISYLEGKVEKIPFQ